MELTLRNLALAERQGITDLLAPCAACYHRLTASNLKLRDDRATLQGWNQRTGLAYGGGVRVVSLLDLLAGVVSCQRIAAAVKRPLDGLRVACYYGCLNTRIQGVALQDDRECPMAMDDVVEALGATPLDWCSRTDCCGGALFVTAEATSLRLVAAILRDAAVRQADCVVVACPMCHSNLEIKQPEVRAEFGIDRPVPVLFLTQLMGLALGASPEAVQLSRNVVPFSYIKDTVRT
jgi:heterodisulfide reductase subunit B